MRVENACHSGPGGRCLRYFRDLLECGPGREAGLNIGVYVGKQLVGYLLSRASGSGSGCLKAQDFQVMSRYRRVAPGLLANFLKQLRCLYPTYQLELWLPPERLSRWHRHAAYLAWLGYRFRDRSGEESSQRGRQPLVKTTLTVCADLPESVVGAAEGYKPRIRSYTYQGREYELEVIRHERHWPQLEGVWDERLLQTPDCTVFQTYAYQRLWWNHFGLGRRLFLVVIRSQGEILAIAPWQVSIQEYYGKPCRQLGCIGVNWEVDRPQLAFGSNLPSCAAVLVQFLQDQAHQWDLCRFYEQPPTSQSVSALQTGMRAVGCLTGTIADSVAPFLRTTADWDSYYQSLSKRFRKNLRYARNRLESLGDFRYETYRFAPDVRERLADYRSIELRSWKTRAHVGPGRDAHYYRFFEDLADTFGQSGAFHLRLLTLNEQPIAGTFGLEFNKGFYSLHITHDNQYDKFSIGTLLECLELEDCFHSDLREYDFLGGFLNNKRRWTDTARASQELHIYQKYWQLRLLHWLYLVIKPRIKHVVKAGLGERLKSLLVYKERFERARKRGSADD